MPVKVYKSSLTWRKDSHQDAVLAPVVPGWPDVTVYVDDDRAAMLRPTSRKEQIIIYAASLAVLSDDEDDFIDFLRSCKKHDVKIICIEENFEWYPQRSLSIALKAWKAARNNGAAKIGGQISANKRKALSLQGADRIRERWCLPSEAWSTAALLKEADISLNTAKRLLGRRPLEQANYQAKLKRKKNREDRANA